MNTVSSHMPTVAISTIVRGLELWAINLLKEKGCSFIGTGGGYTIVVYPWGTTRQRLIRPGMIGIRNRIVFSNGFELIETVNGEIHNLCIERSFFQKKKEEKALK